MEKIRPTEKETRFNTSVNMGSKDLKGQKSKIEIGYGDLHEPTYNNAGVKSFGIYSDSE